MVAWYQLQNHDSLYAEQLITVELHSSAPFANLTRDIIKPKLTPPPAKPEPAPAETPSPVAENPVPVTPPGTQTAQAAESTSSAPVFQPISKLSKPPAFLHKIEPVYPAAEQRSGSQAYVLAEITLDATGKMLNINIIKSAGSYFDNAVIEAIKQSSFTPGYIDKEPVAVKVLLPFRFKLR